MSHLVARNAVRRLCWLPHYECSGHIYHLSHENFCFSDNFFCSGLDVSDGCWQPHYSAVVRLYEHVVVRVWAELLDHCGLLAAGHGDSPELVVPLVPLPVLYHHSLAVSSASKELPADLHAGHPHSSDGVNLQDLLLM